MPQKTLLLQPRRIADDQAFHIAGEFRQLDSRGGLSFEIVDFEPVHV
jgi:hypothetical protein